MKRIIVNFLSILFICSIAENSIAQNCLPTNINGSVINIGCTQTCTNLLFKIPHLKSTADYTVNTIPYTPNGYVTVSGSEDLTLYNDDEFSSVINLPFTFCFYGATYNKVVVGSNGVITFDDANAATCYNGYLITKTIPYDKGNMCDIFSTYYPKASIFGPYSDLDARVNPLDSVYNSSPPDRKIEWRVEGSAPCRKFVVSYYHVGTFGANPCGLVTPNDFQIVMYEFTGLIDFFIGNKTCLSTTNDNGKAILGIQNWDRTKAVAAPGKNATIWSAVKEGYRFTPNGGTSRFVSSELLAITGAFIVKADTSTSEQGLLDISFNNICPPSNSTTSYIIKTTFSSCLAGGLNLTGYDTITVIKATADTCRGNVTKATCTYGNTGTINITNPVGININYSIDGGATYQTSTIFNVAKGSYTVIAKNITSGCTSTNTFIVDATSSITATSSSSDASCSSAINGSITVNASMGIAPYAYSIDGIIFQASPVLNNLAGNTYNLQVKDNVNCIATLTAIVKSGPGITATTSNTNAACIGSATGSINVSPANGVLPYSYSLNGVTPQASNIFTGLIANNYIILVKDANNCAVSIPSTVLNGSGTSTTGISANAACTGSATGIITVLPPADGLAPFLYSINGGIKQSSNVFKGLIGGATYTMLVSDANNCSFSFSQAVGNAPGVTASATTINAACSGAATGQIIISSIIGTAPYLFSRDSGISYQISNVFSNVQAGSYNIAVKDVNNCIFYLKAIVDNNPGVIVTTVIDKASCAIVPNGKITVNPIAGIAPFKYSIDGVNFQTSNQFLSLFSGPYTITIFDSALCSTKTTVVVGDALRVVIDSVTIIRPTCNGLSNGNVAVYPSLGAPPYQYAINSGAFQASQVFNNIAAAANDTIHIKDNSGCVKDTIISVTEPSLLSIASSATSATCTGTPDGKITVTAAGGTLPYQYTSDPLAISGYQANPELLLLVGNYKVSVQDAKGCIASKNDTVLLYDTMRLELGKDTTFCEGIGTTLQPQTNNGTTVFQWTPATGLSNPAIKNPLASPADTTKYYLTAKWGICQRNDSITLNILLRPDVNAGKDTAVCFNTPVFLKGSVGKVSGPVSFLWAPANLIQNPTAAITTSNPDASGTFNYTLTVSDQYGCNYGIIDTVKITVQPQVPAFAGNDTIAVTGNSLPHQLQATGGGPGGSYTWSWTPLTGVSISDRFVANPTVLLQNQQYEFDVKVTDFAGCTGYDTVKITVFDGPAYYLPNAFSPNGDGRNDIFRPTPVGISSTLYFRIFNRYGKLIFETNQWMAGWDGNFMGKPQQTGTYVWALKGKDRKGRVIETKGTVVLIR